MKAEVPNSKKRWSVAKQTLLILPFLALVAQAQVPELVIKSKSRRITPEPFMLMPDRVEELFGRAINHFALE